MRQRGPDLMYVEGQMDDFDWIDLAGSIGDIGDGSAETFLISPIETAELIHSDDSIPQLISILKEL